MNTGKETADLKIIVDDFYDLIEFVPDEDTPIVHFAQAYKLIGQIDSDDLSFVALSSFEDEFLLTGDKKLANGLIKQRLPKSHNLSTAKRKA